MSGPNDEIMDVIDDKIAELANEIQTKYPDRPITGELFLCFHQFAIELLVQDGLISKADFMSVTEDVWNSVRSQIKTAEQLKAMN